MLPDFVFNVKIRRQFVLVVSEVDHEIWEILIKENMFKKRS